jgi:hypothetical protein
MGKSDNRRSLKMRQRKAWRRKKLRMRKKIDEAKTAKTGGGARAKKPSAPVGSAVRRGAAE